MTAAQLKAAILDLAIHGKLVPQDPNDEPASKLLDRIVKARLKCGRDKLAKSECSLREVEQPFAIPQGWAWSRLNDLVMTPITYGIIKLEQEDVSGVKVLRSSDVKSGYIAPEGIRTVSKKISEAYSRTILKGGEVVVNVRGTLGGCALVPIDYAGCNVAREVAVVNQSREMNGHYLMWCLISDYFWRYLSVNLKGIAYKGLNIGLLNRFTVPIPPLAEQKRIVAKIDELMPLVQRYEAAEKRRKTLDEQMPDALKKSILKAAFDGELTEGVALEDKSLDAVCADIFTGNSLSDDEKRAFSKAEGLPFIGTKDVGFDQVVDYENGLHIPEAKSKYRTARAGSSLLCVEGGSSGRKLAILDRDVRFGNKLCAFTPGKKLDGKYLFFYLQSPQFQKQFTDLQNGPRKGAGITQIKALHIPFTDMDNQTRIVERIEAFLAELKRLEPRK